ncbi:hypothetical protein I0C86_20915, partial [Plantactinospora sp. S1510]
IRSAGRKAGRQLGWKILTHQSDPARREDGHVVVIVAVEEHPNPEERQRMKERSRLLFDHMHGDDGCAGRTVSLEDRYRLSGSVRCAWSLAVWW